MKRLIFLTAISILVTADLVLAAGGGGGGGGGSTPPPPSCTEDTWTCTDWGQCSIDGKQARICTLTNNCPTAETPKPAEEQSCTPACTEDTWTCTDWSTPSLTGEQTRTCTLKSDCPLVDNPKPIEKQQGKPSCTKDEWQCTGYGACKGGKQFRNCTLKFDCPLTQTPKPQEEKACAISSEDAYQCNDWSQCQADGKERRTCSLREGLTNLSFPKPEEERFCPGLRCGQLSKLEDRMSCRLTLTSKELAQEFQVLYFPEYCKSEGTKEEQNVCIAFYQSVGPCWKLPPGKGRSECAQKAISLKAIQSEKAECLNKTGNERAACAHAFKEKVERLTIFHMYDLEVQAEALLAKGLTNKNDVVEIETFIENKKQELGSKDTVREWKRILQEVKDKWREFKLKIKK